MSTRSAKITTVMLAATSGLLGLVLLAQWLGWGQGYNWLEENTEDKHEFDVGTIEREQFKLPAEASFSETALRPIFNEDRKPTPEAPVEAVASDAPPALPLNVVLTGVILTPELQMAMLHDNAKNSTLALKEGMPMPADQGSWTLFKIKPRSVVFKSAADDSVEVELNAAADGPKSALAGRPGQIPPFMPPAMPAPMMPKTENPAPSKQAEDLQRRIEERRRQMREEAEKLRQHGAAQPSDGAPNQNLENQNRQNQ